MSEPNVLVEKVLRGHLSIRLRPESAGKNKSWLEPCDLIYELDGVDIGDNLAGLEFKMEPRKPMKVSLDFWLCGMDIDAPSIEVLARGVSPFSDEARNNEIKASVSKATNETSTANDG